MFTPPVHVGVLIHVGVPVMEGCQERCERHGMRGAEKRGALWVLGPETGF